VAPHRVLLLLLFRLFPPAAGRVGSAFVDSNTEPNPMKTAGDPGGFFLRRSAQSESEDSHRIFHQPIRQPGPVMTVTTDDVRIREIKELAPPSHLLREYPIGDRAAATTFASRQATHRILHSMDDRLLVVVGPCSIHDTKAALEYAQRLVEVRERLKEDLEIVMRVYFE